MNVEVGSMAGGSTIAALEDTVTQVGAGGLLLALFGYGITILRAGTDRIDRTAAERIAAAEAERDRARAELDDERDRNSEDEAALRARHREEVDRLTGEVAFWRALAMEQRRGGTDPPLPPNAPTGGPG